ncbi:uncharacterized protein LOC119577110 [Penaeus monodon]|uniref:uncharacterized protein LOC119577110 n=1 Tax=Penaeus monodon TaxID=6687 RepID=UPI0018A6F8CD|nr:uncharacterized protein LOC119577110 [Penaeus monodon]
MRLMLRKGVSRRIRVNAALDLISRGHMDTPAQASRGSMALIMAKLFLNIAVTWLRDRRSLVEFHHLDLFFVLKTLSNGDAYSQVEGPGERVVAAGSGLRLVCVIKGATEPPAYIFWFQNERMVNFDANRGVNVTSERDRSVLTVGAATDDHAGNYTCQPSNAWPASVLVHVVVETTESGASKGPKVGGKTPVQLGVKSASSDGPRILPQTLALFLLGLLLDALTFPRVFHTRL